MAYINPFIKVNQGGIPRLEAISVDTTSGSIYKFKEHRFLNFPYAGLIIFKLPKVATPTAGNVYFTTGDSNILVLDAFRGYILNFRYGGEAGVVPCFDDGTPLIDGRVQNVLQEDDGYFLADESEVI